MLQPILKVNLTSGQITTFEIPRAWVVDYIGAASLAARILYEHLTPELDPLSPEAPLLILNGPLSGTAGPAVGRFVICAKSPATDLWGESNIGGFAAPEIRKAGYDGIWIEGKSPTPSYLWIHDGQVKIRDAAHLWGTANTYETQEKIQAELAPKNIRVLTIGAAGESKLPCALILADHGRVAGRTGMGAVMGSKNLKAIAIKGTQKIPVINWEKYKPARTRANKALRTHNQTQILKETGTAAAADYFDYLGAMPKKYWQRGEFSGTSNITGSAMSETILSGISACHACVIACGRVVTLSDGAKRKGPEYETMVGFGPNLLIGDLAEVTRLGELCDEYGMDTITVSNTIGLAFKLFEDGVITEAHTNGIRLKWGDPRVVTQCVHWMATRDGFGKLLSLGARGLAAAVGAPDEAVHVNGLEPGYHDPRGMSGMALVYATSPRGACHNQSDYFVVDMGHTEEALGIQFFERHAQAEKAANVAKHQDWRTVGNALVLCQFANVPPTAVLELTNAALGLDWSLTDLLRAGERGWNLKRLINQRLGLTRANDTLPKALLKAYPDGGSAGFVPDLPAMLTAYYTARGWDSQTGMPTPEKLVELNLGWTINLP